MMKTDFRIFKHRNSENMHLKLMGVFNENAALELITVLETNCDNINKVIIHTGCLDKISHNGWNNFQNRLSGLNGVSSRIHFTGDKSTLIALNKPAKTAAQIF